MVCYIFLCFHACCDGEYYYLFATVGDVDKRVICCVCIYNKMLMIVYVRGYLFLLPELKKLGQYVRCTCLDLSFGVLSFGV